MGCARGVVGWSVQGEWMGGVCKGSGWVNMQICFGIVVLV